MKFSYELRFLCIQRFSVYSRVSGLKFFDAMKYDSQQCSNSDSFGSKSVWRSSAMSLCQYLLIKHCVCLKEFEIVALV